MLRHWTAILLVGCLCLGCDRTSETLKPKAIVGTWDVSGEFAPIVQTFKEDGNFTSESEVEISIRGGDKVVARFVFSGAYRETGRQLETTITGFDVLNVAEPERTNIVKNGGENLQRTYRGRVEWKSPDRFLVHPEKGNTLLYNRKN